MTDESSSQSAIPKGWIWARIGEVGELIRGVSYSKSESSKEAKDGFIPILRATNINSKLDYSDLVYVPHERVKTEQKIIALDILIAMSSGSKSLVGKAAQAEHDFDGSFGTFCGLLRVSFKINRKFVGLFFQSDDYRREISKHSSGININNLRREHIESMQMPIAPFNEQGRIVAKVEELLSILDAGVEALGKAKAQLKRYRQAVLKYAFEGKLTKEWRKTHKDQIEPAQKLLERLKYRKKDVRRKHIELPPVADLPSLPAEWALASLGQLSERIVDCLHSTPKFTASGKYCVDTNCIEPNRILIEKARFVSEETYEDRVRRLVPTAGDVLFAREGTIGTAVLVPENVELCLGQRMMMFRPEEEVLSSFFMWGLLSPFFEKQWKAKITGSTVNHVNIGDLKSMHLPLASMDEQKVIVGEVERYMSMANETDGALEKSLKYAERMHTSILKIAFEGKLVPQDPTDEPADKLLERIKKEKAKHEAGTNTDDSLRERELMRYVE